MKLNELVINQQVSVQFIISDEVMEFNSYVIDRDDEGIYIASYLYNNAPLELNIDMDDSVICNIFSDDQVAGQRVSWRNVCLATIDRGSQVVYYIKTSKFKALSNNEDRRKNERMPVKKKAQIYDASSGKYTTIVINDVSENGISFYANAKYVPTKNQINIVFEDNIGVKSFNLKINCSITRHEKKNGNLLYGCSINEDNREYLVYVLMKKLSFKNLKMAI